ncbi:MAG: DNA adenine methylase [Firmicutes bacterium]|jgi:DNA adenine methylase|nr:DNA adenine methylase [Bacillota bacterium]
MRQLIKYPGSKWSLADWIAGFFPGHHSYLEPYFGSGAVLFNKKPSKIETVNDLDGEVANLFGCIKSDPERLAGLIEMTPYSREVFENAYQPGTGDRFEKAARFMTRCDMGHGFRVNGENVGFKMDIQGRENAYAIKHWNMLPDLIMECAARLKQVQIENRPAINVIERFNFPNVLIYADPPYLLGTRHGKQYREEMTNGDHEELLEALLAHKGPVVLSGYESDLYNDTLRGWHKERHRSRNQRNRAVKEVLWMNFEPAAQMRMEL